MDGVVRRRCRRPFTTLSQEALCVVPLDTLDDWNHDLAQTVCVVFDLTRSVHHDPKPKARDASPTECSHRARRPADGAPDQARMSPASTATASFCALAVFNIPNGAKVPGHAQGLLNVLRERARLTDVVGWLNEETLCAFLTDATLDGAAAFAAGVQAAVADRMPALWATVHNYDGKWVAIGREDVPAEPVPALAMSA